MVVVVVMRQIRRTIVLTSSSVINHAGRLVVCYLTERTIYPQSRGPSDPLSPLPSDVNTVTTQYLEGTVHVVLKTLFFGATSYVYLCVCMYVCRYVGT